MMASDTIATIFAPLLGQMAWQVRSDEHGCVMMEFGAPHLDVREPILAKRTSSPKVKRLLARRAVTVMGDWHLWIESCTWGLKTRNGATSSEDETSDFWRDWMDDITGQHLVSVEASAPGPLTLRFDMGAVLEVRPDADGELNSWSLHAWQGSVTVCDAAGGITVEREKA
jgi:hypothetical protein